MVKRDIITHIPFVPRVANLVFLGYAGTDKCELVCYVQIFFCVNRRAHQRALNRNKLWYQLWNIMFYIIDNCRAWLRNAALKMMFCYVLDISPCSNVSPKAYTYDTVRAQLFKSAKYLPIFIRIICRKCRCPQNRYFLTLCKRCKKFLRVIHKIPRMVLAGIKAGAACNASVPVHFYPLLPVLHLDRPVRHNDRTDRNAFITADTVVIGKD